MPEIPRRIVERTTQYANTRGAALLDFDPDGDGILVATRFGETAQVHHVAGPGMDRQQWTFFPEPVTSAAYDPSEGSRGFFFRMDAGGNEFYQYHWFDRATGRSTLLTDGTSRHETWLPSPSGGKAAFSGTARNRADFDIHVATRAAGGWSAAPDVKRVKDVKGQWNAVDWSPDEKRLLLVQYVSANESMLHVLDLASDFTSAYHGLSGGVVDGHPNDLGYEVVARRLADFLLVLRPFRSGSPWPRPFTKQAKQASISTSPV